MPWNFKHRLNVEFLPQNEPPGTYEPMVRSLFSEIVTPALAAVLVPLYAFVAAAHVPTQALFWLAAATMVAGIARALFVAAFRWTDNPGRAGYALRPWEYAYALGAAAFSLLFGLCGAVTVAYDAPAVVQLMMVILLNVYACGIAGRNAQRPWVSSLQMWVSILPTLGVMCCLGVAAWSWPHLLFLVGVGVSYLSIRVQMSAPLYRTMKAYYLNQEEKAQLDGQFALALDNMGNGFALFDRESRIVFANERLAGVLGVPADLLAPTCKPDAAFAALAAEGGLAPEAGEALAARFAHALASGSGQDFEAEVGGGRTVEFSFNPIAAGAAAGTDGTVVVLEDITERKRSAARIEHLARIDALTDLPNRFSFKHRLGELVAGPDRFAVLAIDLDKFKNVNDTLGHSVGDKLLRAVADRLRAITTGHDMVSRFGGDEFMVILGMLDRNDDAALFAKRIVQTLSKPYQIDIHQLVIGASVGIALAPDHAADPDTLLQYADMALYRVKAERRGDYKFFDAAMDAQAQEKRLMEIDLRDALAKGELQVHFQPQHNIAAGRYLTCEALARWISPVRGFVRPDKFIEVAEETGMIVEIGEFVLRESCLAAREWPADMRVAVNVSAVQLQAGNLVQTVRRVLGETGFPAHRLELEITESTMMKDPERVQAIMRELQEIGVRISLDDFGTGNTSLSYLQSYSFNKLKIDKSFVDEITKSAKDRSIVKAVAGLSREMGMSVTVEGVETEEQVGIVGDLGCTDIQGWYYSKALPQAALLPVLRESAARAAEKAVPKAVTSLPRAAA